MDSKLRGMPQPWRVSRHAAKWGVFECPAFKSRVSWDDKSQAIYVPKRVLREDWLVQKHELTHAGDMTEYDANMPKGRAALFYRMLTEVHVEARSLHFSGVDIRCARDHLDWTRFPRPDENDLYQVANLWLQLCFSAGTARHPAIGAMFQWCSDVLGAERVGWLCQARDAVIQHCLVKEGSGANRAAWARWLAKLFPKVGQDKKGDDGNGQSGDSQGESQESAGNSREVQEGDDSEQSDDSRRSDDSEPGADDGDAPSSADDDTDGSGTDDDDSDNGEPGDSASDDSAADDDDSSDATGDSGQDDGDDDDSDGDDSDAGTQDTSAGDDDDSDDGDDGDASSDPLEGLGERTQAANKRQEEEAARERRERESAERIQTGYAFDPSQEHAIFVTGGTRIQIHRHPAQRSARKVEGAGGQRAHESGRTLAYPRRLYQDGRVMVRNGGKVGAAVLVDGSGSMGWVQANAERALAVVPGLWLGWYSLHKLALERYYQFGVYGDSGYDYARGAKFWMRLCIVAEKGKVGTFNPQDPEERAGHAGGNWGDAEVLEYLSRLPGTKVWVSDGQVHGNRSHGQRCNAIMKRAGIVRVAYIQDAIAYLEGKTVTGWHTVHMGRPGEQIRKLR